MKLKPGQMEEYSRRHAAIWPELTELLKEQGITEYSIFFDAETETLFAFQRVSGLQSSQELGSRDVVRRWWNYMADIMLVNEDLSPVTRPLKEVFYLE